MSADVFLIRQGTRRGGESVSLFQEGTDTAGPSEDSNIATWGKEGKTEVSVSRRMKQIHSEGMTKQLKNRFVLNRDRITPKSFTANGPRLKVTLGPLSLGPPLLEYQPTVVSERWNGRGPYIQYTLCLSHRLFQPCGLAGRATMQVASSEDTETHVC